MYMRDETYMIFYDRGCRAQDNAEYLCRWVMKNHPEIKTSYILNSNSYDWERLAGEGFNLIDGLNKCTVRQELLQSDYVCSSIFNEGIFLNFDGCHCKRIFLNHGCFLVPINYLKNEKSNVDLFIAANKIEYDTMLNPYHTLSKDQVALCGQPRQDDLIRAQKRAHEENTILIQFWQRPVKWSKDNNKLFLESAFYKKTCALLSNKKLIETCKNKGLKIVFKMHPIQYNWMQYYKKYVNDIVKLSPISEPFEPEFIKSKLLITDISSNAYEMAKINKPCIYFEPDLNDLFPWRLKKNDGFEFDLDKNSIGPVIKESVDKVVNEICNLINNNFILKEPYITRRKQQISFLNDDSSCQRCFDAIMKVKRSRTAEKTAAANRPKADGRLNCFLYF